MALRDRFARRWRAPAGTTSTPIDPAQAAALAGVRTQPVDAQQMALAAALGDAVNQQTPMFSPGAPLPSATGIEPAAGPRQFPFPVGYNIAQTPRSTELTSFDKLRNLARLYDGVQLCEKVYFDIIRQLTPAAVPVKAGDEGDPDEVAGILAFFERPDGQANLDDWACMAIRDVLEIDALSVYAQRGRGGKLLGLDVIDGSTIKPLLDARGKTPLPPLPGYQQFLYGVPGGMYTGDSLLYRRENPRSDSPYGISRVEMILMRVNQALRKQNFDLARFTDGNVPAGLLAVPDDTTWTPDQIQEFEDAFNALLAGNDRARNRIKVLPPGFSYTPTAAADLLTPFDTFLLNVTVGAFGLTMAELGFTESVNKSSGDSQENVVYRRAVKPTARIIASLFTHVMHTSDLDPGRRYRFQWSGLEEEDKDAIASRYAKLIPIGAATVDDYRSEVGLPKLGYPAYIITQGAGVVWLDDQMKLRDSQVQAQMAGLKLAASNPAAATQKPGQPGGEEPPEGDGPPARPGQPKPGEGDEARADLKRYQEIALKAVRSGRPVRRFDSAVLPADVLECIAGELARCASAEAVRAVFAEAGRAANPFDRAATTPLAKAEWFAPTRVARPSPRWKEPSGELLALEERLRALLGRWLASWKIWAPVRRATADGGDAGDAPDVQPPADGALIGEVAEALTLAANLGGAMALAQLGIGGTFDLRNPRAVAAIREHAAQLVTAMTDAQRRDLADLIAQAVDEGLGPRATAGRIREALPEMSRQRSERIARTETIRGLNGSLHETYRRNGVKLKEWDANPNACPLCQANAGQEPIGMDEQFGDGSLFPPAHPGCRCSLWPVVSDEYVPGDWAGGDDEEAA